MGAFIQCRGCGQLRKRKDKRGFNMEYCAFFKKSFKGKQRPPQGFYCYDDDRNRRRDVDA